MVRSARPERRAGALERGAGQARDREVRRRRDHRGLATFIAPVERIAVLDNDGTLWSELEWTAAGQGARFMGLVHHTDAEREWAYDRKSPIGTLDKARDEAVAKSWTIVDMKTDWKVVYPNPE